MNRCERVAKKPESEEPKPDAKKLGELWKEYQESAKKETPLDRQRKVVNYILLSTISLIAGLGFMFLSIKTYSGVDVLISFFSLFLSFVFSIAPVGNFGEGKQGLLFWLVCSVLTVASVGSLLMLIIALIPPI